MNQSRVPMTSTTPKLVARPGYVRTDVAALWRLLLTLVLSVAVPLYLVVSTDDVRRSSAWILTVPVVAWSGYRLAQRVSDGSDRYAVLMFWIFNYIFFGLAPLVQLRTGLLPTTTDNVAARFDERTMLVIVASLAAFEVGSKLAPSRRDLGDTDEVHRGRIRARVVAAFCLIGLVLAWGYVARVGIANVVASRSVHASARSLLWPDPAVSEVAYATAFVPLLVGAHLLLLGRTRPDLVSSPKIRTGLMLLVFATLAIVVNPVGSARFIFGAVWLSVLAQRKFATRARARLFSLAIVVGFLFVFPIADKFSRPSAEGKKFRALQVFQGNGDYDAFAQTNNSINMVAHNGLSYGRQLAGLMFFWVPRSLWSGKPRDTALVISDFMGYSFKNLSAPLVSELYVNGGVILVVIGFALIGFALRRWLDGGGSAHSAALCIVACVVPFYSPILLRGSLLQATGYAALFALCVLILRWTTRASNRASSHIEVPLP